MVIGTCMISKLLCDLSLPKERNTKWCYHEQLTDHPFHQDNNDRATEADRYKKINVLVNQPKKYVGEVKASRAKNYKISNLESVNKY